MHEPRDGKVGGGSCIGTERRFGWAGPLRSWGKAGDDGGGAVRKVGAGAYKLQINFHSRNLIYTNWLRGSSSPL